MSGIDPDEEANISENPDPESESSAVNEIPLVEEISQENTEGKNCDNIGEEQALTRNNQPCVNVPREGHIQEDYEEDEQRIDENSLNQDGNEKTEDEREVDLGVIREGQISGGQDEQISLGQEEAEADASLVLNISNKENVSENDNHQEAGSEESANRSALTQECENYCEETTSVINVSKDVSNGETEATQAERVNSLENLSQENSVVVEANIIIPEDEYSCQDWASKNRPQLHVLSPSGSIESCEPECDQEAEASISCGDKADSTGDQRRENDLEDKKNEGEEEEEKEEEEETICVILNPSPHDQFHHSGELCSNSSSQDRNVENMCSIEDILSVHSMNVRKLSVNGDLTPVDVPYKRNSVQSDEDLLSELETELTNSARVNQNSCHMSDPEVNIKSPNGLDCKVLQEIQDLQIQLKHSKAKLEEKDSEIKR